MTTIAEYKKMYSYRHWDGTGPKDHINDLCDKVDALENLVKAIHITALGHMWAMDINGKNWFDSRDEVLK